MNLHTTSFFNSTEVNISSRMNEYMKKNFGYEVEGDFDTLREAKKSLEAEQLELKDKYMSAKYVENMLMIETISSLLKAHNEKPSSVVTTKEDLNNESAVEEAVGEFSEPLYTLQDDLGLEANILVDELARWMDAKDITEFVKTFRQNHDLNHPGEDDDYGEDDANFEAVEETAVEEADEEKGPDHYKMMNSYQLDVALGRIESAMKALDHAIQYRSENSDKFLRGFEERAGVGDLMRIKEKLVDIHSNWEKETEYYGM